MRPWFVYFEMSHLLQNGSYFLYQCLKKPTKKINDDSKMVWIDDALVICETERVDHNHKKRKNIHIKVEIKRTTKNYFKC